jgi:hypothetical protein
MDFEICFFDNCVRPNSRDQFPRADHFPRSLDQGGEDFQGATAEANRSARFQQYLLCWK